jgi:hypothetical protein
LLPIFYPIKKEKKEKIQEDTHEEIQKDCPS